MAMNPKDIDPAIVTSAADKPKPAAPKKEIPVTPKVVAAKQNEETPDAAPKYEYDQAAECLVATVDSKMISMPRTLAAKVPVVAVILADQPADDHSPIPIGTSASATIAIAHWVEHVGSASGKSETPMPEGEIVYTDMTSFLHTEWEKDFDTRILTAESDTMLRVINFAEQNGMIGLLDYCVAALSCALRGKSNHEMMVAMCVDGEEMSAEEIAQGKEAYPWIADITKPSDE